MRRLGVLLVVLLSAPVLAISLSSCDDDNGMHDHVDGGHDCSQEMRADAWMINLVKDGDGGALKVKIVSADPASPTKGDNTWNVQVLDSGDTPLDGVTIGVTPFMPDHGHGSPIDAVVTETGTNSEYEVTPINLWMPGYWEVTFDLDDGAGTTDTAVVKVCIDG